VRNFALNRFTQCNTMNSLLRSTQLPQHLSNKSNSMQLMMRKEQTQITHSAISGQYSLRFKRCAPKYDAVPKKLKTKSAAKKRFRITGGGKIKRRMAGKQHHAWAKNRAKKNKLRTYKFITNRKIHKRLTTMLNFK
jgi:ribosomal protein L35